MDTLFFDSTTELRREKEKLEKELDVQITISGRKVTFESEPIKEYVADLVLQAMSFGFSAKQALLLKSEDIAWRKLQIRDFTRRKNLRDVRGRLIGSEGKTRRTVEEISDCLIMIKNDSVGILGRADAIDAAIQAVINIIRGSKQANAYRYLERMNTLKKEEGLGLKIKNKK